MKTDYRILRNIFIQSALSSALMEQKIKALNINVMNAGELNYWFWRYVFTKDVTKKTLTNRLLKLGLDNLTVIEAMDALNATRNAVKELLRDAKEYTK